MLRKLYAMIRVGFFLEFAYPISFLFFIILPVAFTAAVSAGLGGMMNETDEPPQEVRSQLYVLSQDTGDLSGVLMETLEENNLEPIAIEELPEDAFTLEIPAGFSEDLMSGKAVTMVFHTLPTNSASQAVEQYIRASISRLGGAVLVAEMGLEQASSSGLIETESEKERFFREVLEETLVASETPIATSEITWAGDINLEVSRSMATSAEQASAGQIVTWTQITLLAAAEVFVAEREGGTLRRLLVSPSPRFLTLLGKLLSRLILGLVQMAILFFGGSLLFGVQWGKSPLALLVVSLSFALATVGLGTLIATFVRSRSQANSVVIGLAMAMSALGGAWYPLEITPPLYRQVVKILPSNWAMQAYTDLLVRNAGLTEVLPAVGVLLLFALVFISVGILRFRRFDQSAG
jgi:ABC-2 type transport system permease protein